MVFSSLTFLYFFLPVTLGVYYISPKRLKNLILLLSGLFFYAWGEPKYVFVMILSAAIDYTAGRVMAANDHKKAVRTICLIASVCMNVGLLALFKYSSFFVRSVNSAFGTSIADPGLPLPIGISFYTFQSMSYTIDLYRRKIGVQKNIIDFMAYVAMFPQIVAGPIVTYDKVADQMKDHSVTLDRLSDGIALFVRGLGKKVLLANNIGMLWDNVSSTDFSSLSMVTAWIGIIAFAFQIYFDFSGYSDMAVGLGKMLGFEFPQNFDLPYTANSITDFWRRWHITLGAWFREYVYIPLGGNRKGESRTVINLAVTWLLTGLWHGSSWNFVLWGGYFGLLIIMEKFLWGKFLEKLPGFVRTVYTFVLVLFGWVMFETETLGDAFRYFKAMFGLNKIFYDRQATYLIVTYAVIFVICAVGSSGLLKKITGMFSGLRFDIKAAAAPFVQVGIMLLSTAYLVNESYNPFLYFRF